MTTEDISHHLFSRRREKGVSLEMLNCLPPESRTGVFSRRREKGVSPEGLPVPFSGRQDGE